MLCKGRTNSSVATTQMLDYIAYLTCIKTIFLFEFDQDTIVKEQYVGRIYPHAPALDWISSVFSCSRFEHACPVWLQPLQEISPNTLAWVFSRCLLNWVRPGRRIISRTSRCITQPHKQQGDTCLKGKHHPYLSCFAPRGLGFTVEFNPLIPKICTEVLQQTPQHRHGFIFTLNKINPDKIRYLRYSLKKNTHNLL